MLHQFFEEVPCTSICVRSTTETWSPTNKHSIPYQMIRYIQVSSAFYVRDVRFLNVPSTYWRENTQNVLTRKYQWYSGNFGTGTAGILFWNLHASPCQLVQCSNECPHANGCAFCSHKIKSKITSACFHPVFDPFQLDGLLLHFQFPPKRKKKKTVLIDPTSQIRSFLYVVLLWHHASSLFLVYRYFFYALCK